MANFYDDNDDLQFYVDRWIDWLPIVELTEHGFRAPDGPADAAGAVDVYREVLRAVGRLAGDEIAPYSVAMDEDGLALVDGDVRVPKTLARVLDRITAMDLHGVSVPRELGGTNCPLLVYFMAIEMLGRADAAVTGHFSFHCGVAMALLFYSISEGSTEFDSTRAVISRTRWQEAIAEIVRGQAWGSMDITEPDAGSDMAALRCSAETDEHGEWFVTGQKIFITSGHGKYHIVVARSEPTASADTGLDGLSLFLVRLYDEVDGERVWHGSIDRIEDKMGQHASSTCAINFDRTPADLIGARGQGFRHMLLMMNGARVAVGMESIGLCEHAYRLARSHASQRASMGKTIDRHEMIADYLDEMRTDIQGLRALAMDCAFHEELRRKHEIALALDLAGDELDARRRQSLARRHGYRARRATPLLKYLAAEKAVEMARRCVQILGGVGYMRELGAEKLLRDAMVLPIYEGTSQIQALMVMKDALRDIMRAPQQFVRRAAQARWRSISSFDRGSRRVARLQVLSLGAQQHLIQKTMADKLRGLPGKPVTSWTRELFRDWDPKRDFAHALLHAERLTRLMADVAIARVLHDQAARHPARGDVLRRHLDRAEPRCRMLYEEITTRGDRLVQELRDLQADDGDVIGDAAE